MKQVRAVAYPDIAQANIFGVANDGVLRQVWIGADGIEHKVDITAHLPGVGKFDPESPITFIVTANGDLCLGVYGADGTPCIVRYHRAQGVWGITPLGGF